MDDGEYSISMEFDLMHVNPFYFKIFIFSFTRNYIFATKIKTKNFTHQLKNYLGDMSAKCMKTTALCL